VTEYRYRNGASIKDVEPMAAFDELMRIRESHDGILSPRDIVNESRPKNAVLHPAFEWNDKVAAEEYRLWQARRVSRAVYVIEPATEDEPERETPAFYHVARNEYQPTEIVIRRPDLFEQALEVLHQKFAAAERAVRELEQAAHQGNNPDRLASIALAVQGFSAVREALAAIK